MPPSTRFAVHFAVAASAVVAIGTLVSELIEDSTHQQFALPPFGMTAAILSAGTFIWSYLVAAGSAWSFRDIGSAAPVLGYVGGAAFALLTPMLGYVLWSMEFPVFAVAMFCWVVLFPAAFTFGVGRWVRSRESLEPSPGR